MGLRQALMSQSRRAEPAGAATPGAIAPSEALAGLLREQAAPDSLAPLLRGARAVLWAAACQAVRGAHGLLVRSLQCMCRLKAMVQGER